jgi:diguanylate cyclase (GGDEF)-like protein
MILRTSFRRKLLLLALLPLALAQLVTIYAVMHTVERDVQDRATDSLRISATVVDEYLAGRSSQMRTSVQVMAADFGLKEAVATGDVETIRSVLRNHSGRVGADLAALFSLDGQLLATTDPSRESGWRLADTRRADAESISALQSTELFGDVGYQVIAVPLRSPMPVAWVALAFRVDSDIVDRMAALTGLDVLLVSRRDETRLLAGSVSVQEIGQETEGLMQGVDVSDRVYVIQVANTNYLATTTRLIHAPVNNAGIDVVLLRSLTDAMAPYVEARQGLIAFGIALILIVAMAGVWLAGSIARPLNVLTDAARKMMSGDYDVDVAIASTDEVGELASTFNAMTAAISEREERISRQALHDRLTDLPNHNYLVQKLERLIAEAATEDHKIFLLSIHLSRMGAISSTLGHNASDQVISLAARLLHRNLEATEVLGHIGAEEFVVILPGVEIDNALERAEKLRAILATGVTLENVNFQLQSTIGVAAYPAHGTEAADTLRKARIARSEAGSRGEQLTIYRHGREHFHVRQLRIVNDLRSAIRTNQIHTWYQPKIRLPDGAPVGVEALVRWEHPEYGWLSPDEFVPAIEEAGTILHLTRFVLREAIRQCRLWQDKGYVLQVSVNVSARDLSDDYLPHYVLQLLREQELPPDRLTLEVTENSVMQQFNRVISVLECLRDVGVRISMDDFGTGQSSLAQLRNIPLRELKVDKSFVMSLPDNVQNEAIVGTTIKLAHSLGLEVVAEGVENEATLRFLAGAGCEQAQGFFLSKPVAPEALEQWLAEYEPVRCMERRTDSRPFRKEA